MLLSASTNAQKQDRIWLFADSAGIDFNNLANPVAINCNLGNPALTSFTSIADNSGSLLFYTGGFRLNDRAMRIYDRNGNIMQNGDSLFGYPWVGQGSMILPMPGDTNRYYVFLANRDGAVGNSLRFSIVDMSLNGGLGEVVLRDSLLLTDHINEKLNATRHANGRDWWVVVQSTNTDSLFHKFLITPDSILGPIDQKIGSGDNPNKAFGQMIFSRDGTKLGLVAENSTVDIFDFDRCSGDLSNYKKVGEGVVSYPNYYFGCSFSANGNVFYASSIWYEYKNIYQYDLTASNVKASKQIIFSYPDTGEYFQTSMGQHLLGPDDKIYIAKGNGFTGMNSDTYYTHHVDVITNPNSLGIACNYEPSYFNLGAGRTIQGFPTMVNYNLGPVIGSICDSLSTSVHETEKEKHFEIFPNPFCKNLTLRFLNSSSGLFTLRDQLGNIIFRENFSGERTINLANLSAGVYYVTMETDGKVFNEKVIKMSDR